MSYSTWQTCQHCGYQGYGHFVGCERLRSAADLAERAEIEARIAAAWAEAN